jgi:acetyl-CoA acetyltransferase family protein
MDSNAPVIVSAMRTPFGKYMGGLSEIRADDLLALTIKELLRRAPQLQVSEIDDVIIGDSNGSGDDNRNVARMGSLLAGVPVTVPGVTVNRLCGSSAEAIVSASRMVAFGDAKFVLAGGVESMSRAPWIVERLGNDVPKNPVFHQSTVGWRLTNPAMPTEWTQPLGRAAEKIAIELGISRGMQDEWALRSHQYAANAWNRGLHDDWVFAIGGITRDESIREDTTLERLAGLKSAFSESGPLTAGNSSPLNDGSVVSLISSVEGAGELGITPIVRIKSSRVVGVSPERFTTAPIFAIQKILARNNLKISDIDVWEINEAFAAMVLTVLDAFPEIDLENVNINGGAIALGHPIGASASRAVIDCGRQLARTGGRYGIAAACIGVGQGIAVLLESV